ncbi:hypothetical protein CKO20_15890 [Rhodocyclus tenuis]|nr:hypothetical protein [Rhodocyclus tenuis]
MLQMRVFHAKVFQYFVLVIAILELKVCHAGSASPKAETVHVLDMYINPLIQFCMNRHAEMVPRMDHKNCGEHRLVATSSSSIYYAGSQKALFDIVINLLANEIFKGVIF